MSTEDAIQHNMYL